MGNCRSTGRKCVHDDSHSGSRNRFHRIRGPELERIGADNLLGLYAGGAVGQSHVRSEDSNDGSPGCCQFLNFDESHTGWKVFAGVRPIPVLGVEVAYIDFGTVTAPSPFPSSFYPGFSDSSKQSAAALFAVGYLPLP